MRPTGSSQRPSRLTFTTHTIPIPHYLLSCSWLGSGSFSWPTGARRPGPAPWTRSPTTSGLIGSSSAGENPRSPKGKFPPYLPTHLGKPPFSHIPPLFGTIHQHTQVFNHDHLRLYKKLQFEQSRYSSSQPPLPQYLISAEVPLVGRHGCLENSH